MTLLEQSVNVVRCVFQTVLIEDTRTAGQAHGGEAVVLRDDDVPGAHVVDEGEIDAVRALVEDQRLGSVPLDAVGGVAQNQNRYAVRAADAEGQVDDRAAVGVDQNGWHERTSCLVL